MEFGFLYDLPLAAVCVVMVAGLVCAALSGLALVRRFVLPRLRIKVEDSEFVGTMVQAIMVFYGLAVALIAVSVWQTYSDANNLVSEEAACLAALYRDVTLYPEPHRTALRRDISDYVEFVIKEAWPAQRKGRVMVAPAEFVKRMTRNFAAVEPATEQMKLQHGEGLRALNEAIKATRLRVDAATGGLPIVLWSVIFVGGVLGIVSTFFFKVEDARLHSTMVSLLAGFIGLVIFMIFALDRPFRGEIGISSAPYELIYNQIINPASDPKRP